MERRFGMTAVKRSIQLGAVSGQYLDRPPNVGEVTRPVGGHMEQSPLAVDSSRRRRGISQEKLLQGWYIAMPNRLDNVILHSVFR